MGSSTEVRAFHGGAPGLGQDVTDETVRFKKEDDDAADALTPVEVPDSGYAYSWRKSFKLVATALPDTQLSNLRAYSDGVSLGTGRDLLVATSTSYTQASSADETAAISGVDVDDYTALSPLVLQAGAFVTSGDTAPTDGNTLQPYLVLQLRVGATAQAGDVTAAKSIQIIWDET